VFNGEKKVKNGELITKKGGKDGGDDNGDGENIFNY